MNFKQFRKVANGHSRTTLTRGRTVGERGFCLQSKLGLVISLKRLEALLEEDRQRQTLLGSSKELLAAEQ